MCVCMYLINCSFLKIIVFPASWCLPQILPFFFFFLFFGLAIPCCLWDLSSPIRD